METRLEDGWGANENIIADAIQRYTGKEIIPGACPVYYGARRRPKRTDTSEK